MRVITAKSRIFWNFKLMVSIVLATLFAPLLYGAFSAFFWEENSEQSERQMVISRIVDSLDGVILYFRRTSSEPIHNSGRCQIIAGKLSALSNPPGMVMFGFHHRAEVQQQIEITSEINEIRAEPLKQLPSVVLGALDAYDRSSPLSPVCRAYASNKLHKLSKVQRQNVIRAVNRDAEPGWCAFLDTVDPELKSSRMVFNGRAI